MDSRGDSLLEDANEQASLDSPRLAPRCRPTAGIADPATCTPSRVEQDADGTSIASRLTFIHRNTRYSDGGSVSAMSRGNSRDTRPPSPASQMEATHTHPSSASVMAAGVKAHTHDDEDMVQEDAHEQEHTKATETTVTPTRCEAHAAALPSSLLVSPSCSASSSTSSSMLDVDVSSVVGSPSPMKPLSHSLCQASSRCALRGNYPMNVDDRQDRTRRGRVVAQPDNKHDDDGDDDDDWDGEELVEVRVSRSACKAHGRNTTRMRRKAVESGQQVRLSPQNAKHAWQSHTLLDSSTAQHRRRCATTSSLSSSSCKRSSITSFTCSAGGATTMSATNITTRTTSTTDTTTRRGTRPCTLHTASSSRRTASPFMRSGTVWQDQTHGISLSIPPANEEDEWDEEHEMAGEGDDTGVRSVPNCARISREDAIVLLRRMHSQQSDHPLCLPYDVGGEDDSVDAAVNEAPLDRRGGAEEEVPSQSRLLSHDDAVHGTLTSRGEADEAYTHVPSHHNYNTTNGNSHNHDVNVGYVGFFSGEMANTVKDSSPAALATDVDSLYSSSSSADMAIPVATMHTTTPVTKRRVRRRMCADTARALFVTTTDPTSRAGLHHVTSRTREATAQTTQRTRLPPTTTPTSPRDESAASTRTLLTTARAETSADTVRHARRESMPQEQLLMTYAFTPPKFVFSAVGANAATATRTAAVATNTTTTAAAVHVRDTHTRSRGAPLLYSPSAVPTPHRVGGPECTVAPPRCDEVAEKQSSDGEEAGRFTGFPTPVTLSPMPTKGTPWRAYGRESHTRTMMHNRTSTHQYYSMNKEHDENNRFRQDQGRRGGTAASDHDHHLNVPHTAGNGYDPSPDTLAEKRGKDAASPVTPSKPAAPMTATSSAMALVGNEGRKNEVEDREVGATASEGMCAVRHSARAMRYRRAHGRLRWGMRRCVPRPRCPHPSASVRCGTFSNTLHGEREVAHATVLQDLLDRRGAEHTSTEETRAEVGRAATARTAVTTTRGGDATERQGGRMCPRRTHSRRATEPDGSCGSRPGVDVIVVEAKLPVALCMQRRVTSEPVCAGSPSLRLDPCAAALPPPRHEIIDTLLTERLCLRKRTSQSFLCTSLGLTHSAPSRTTNSHASSSLLQQTDNDYVNHTDDSVADDEDDAQSGYGGAAREAGGQAGNNSTKAYTISDAAAPCVIVAHVPGLLTQTQYHRACMHVATQCHAADGVTPVVRTTDVTGLDKARVVATAVAAGAKCRRAVPLLRCTGPAVTTHADAEDARIVQEDDRTCEAPDYFYSTMDACAHKKEHPRGGSHSATVRWMPPACRETACDATGMCHRVVPHQLSRSRSGAPFATQTNRGAMAALRSGDMYPHVTRTVLPDSRSRRTHLGFVKQSGTVRVAAEPKSSRSGHAAERSLHGRRHRSKGAYDGGVNVKLCDRLNAISSWAV